VLVLHIVPMMAAMAIQPDRQHDKCAAWLGLLDLLLLLVWWLYLFLLIVIPWQYIHPSEAVYGRRFNVLYFSEHIVFLLSAARAWRRSSGAWKQIYARFFGAGSLYAASFVAPVWP